MAADELKELNLKQTVIQLLEELLPNVKSQIVRVLNAYPSTPDLLPCLSVVQASGGLEEEVIGQVFDTAAEDSQGNFYHVDGVYYRQAVEITVWSLNPSERDLFTPLIRKALWKLRWQLSKDFDFQKSTLNEQGDGQDFEGQAPRDIFLFTWTIAGLVPLYDVTPLGTTDGVTLDLTTEELAISL